MVACIQPNELKMRVEECLGKLVGVLASEKRRSSVDSQ
jgi:hypothetical protein